MGNTERGVPVLPQSLQETLVTHSHPMLPPEILYCLFDHIRIFDVRQVVRLRLICKEWKNLIDNFGDFFKEIQRVCKDPLAYYYGFSTLHPEVKGQPWIQIQAIQYDIDALLTITPATEEVCLCAVEKDPVSMLRLEGRTPNVILAALRKDPKLFRELPDDDQTEEICEIAVNLLSSNFRYAAVRTNRVVLAAIRTDAENFKHTREEEQTPEVCRLAVEFDPLNIRYVKRQTLDMCLVAAKRFCDGRHHDQAVWMKCIPRSHCYFMGLLSEEIRNNDEFYSSACAHCIHYYLSIKNKTSSVNLEVIRQDWRVIELIEIPSEEECLAAVSESTNALRYIKHQSNLIALFALEKDAHSLCNINEQTEEICEIAIEKDPLLLRFVRCQTPSLCSKAILKNPACLEFALYQDPSLLMGAIAKKPEVISYITHLTTPLCLEALRRMPSLIREIPLKLDLVEVLDANPGCFQYLDNEQKTREIIEIAVRKDANNGSFIRHEDFIENPELIQHCTPDVQLAHCDVFKVLVMKRPKSILEIPGFILKQRPDLHRAYEYYRQHACLSFIQQWFGIF